MAKPTGKRELQRLEEERDAILACLAVCEAARVRVDQAFQSITEGRQKSTSKGDERVITSLSELIGAVRWRQNRQPQTYTPCSTGREIDGNTASRSRPASLAHRLRETQPQTKGHSGEGGHRERCGNSPAGSQEDLHEESFIIVENPEEGDPDGEL